MKKYFSNVEPGLLLHLVNRRADMTAGRRIDIAPENEFLQACSLHMPDGTTFKPHKHIYHEKITTIAQESWVVIAGSVKFILYDLDDTILDETIVGPGDMTMTFRGGHNYLVLEDGTLVYEFKTGPYLGQSLDKVFIDA